MTGNNRDFSEWAGMIRLLRAKQELQMQAKFFTPKHSNQFTKNHSVNHTRYILQNGVITRENVVTGNES
jgi:hypothetical protein